MSSLDELIKMLNDDVDKATKDVIENLRDDLKECQDNYAEMREEAKEVTDENFHLKKRVGELSRMAIINRKSTDPSPYDELRVLRGIAEGASYASLNGSASDNAKSIEKAIRQLYKDILDLRCENEIQRFSQRKEVIHDLQERLADACQLLHSASNWLAQDDGLYKTIADWLDENEIVIIKSDNPAPIFDSTERSVIPPQSQGYIPFEYCYCGTGTIYNTAGRCKICGKLKYNG